MDWLTGSDRRTQAADRIYEAATELIATRGFDRFNIDDVAAVVGCSRATVYRHVGGKGDVRDAVLARAIARVAGSVRQSVSHLAGEDRVVMAIVESVRVVRADPVAGALLSSNYEMHRAVSALVGSPQLTAGAAEITGLDPKDELVLEWVVRVVLALLYWPMASPETEEATVRRMVAPALNVSARKLKSPMTVDRIQSMSPVK